MTFRIFSLILMTGLTLSWSGIPGDPVGLIKSKDAELQKLLRQKGKDGKKVRQERIKKLINGIFDFEELGRKSLGSKVYKKITEEQKKSFISAFRRMIESSSMKQLESYKSDSTVYKEPKYSKKNTKVKVTAHTFFDGQETVLVYKMFLVEGSWKTWDLLTDDLSTYGNYKNQFKRILKTKSIDELITLLKNKAESNEPVKP